MPRIVALLLAAWLAWGGVALAREASPAGLPGYGPFTWGMTLAQARQKCPELGCFAADPRGVTTCTRAGGENLAMGEARLRTVSYQFVQGRLAKVLLVGIPNRDEGVAAADNLEQLRRYLQSRYGAPASRTTASQDGEEVRQTVWRPRGGQVTLREREHLFEVMLEPRK